MFIRTDSRKLLYKKLTLTKGGLPWFGMVTDDFLISMSELKRELNGIGNNFNQAVHKLHLLDKIPEFRVWVQQYDGVQKLLTVKIEEIKLRMVQLYEELLIK